MKKLTFLALSLAMFLTSSVSFAQENFLGEIRMVGFNFAPKGWAKCEGQILQINQNEALFALLGTTYGGDGLTTFALPDMRGRVPMSDGDGMGLTPRVLGETGGSETNTLTISQMPAHSHTVNMVSTEGNQNNPAGNLLADTKLLDKEYSNENPSGATMNANMISVSGGSQPVNNIQPYTAVTFVIALQGIFPSRN